MNRTPPKTQAALLQAMQEYRITAGGRTYPLELPFLVFATQNPIEQEGTYPLPEAQLDRFMFLVDVGYPTAEEEVQIVKSTTGGAAAEAGEDPLARAHPRAAGAGAPGAGAGPRGALRGGAGAPHAPQGAGRARLRREERVLGRRPARQPVPGARAPRRAPSSTAASWPRWRTCGRWPGPVLRHRVLPNFTAESEGITSVKLVDQLLARGEGLGAHAMALLDAQTLSRLAGREAARPRGDGGRALRPPQEPPPGPERGVRRAQGVRARRRAAPPGLEGLRQVRQVLRQALRARDEPALGDGRGCVRLHGLPQRRAVQAGGGQHARRRARATCWCASRTRRAWP